MHIYFHNIYVFLTSAFILCHLNYVLSDSTELLTYKASVNDEDDKSERDCELKVDDDVTMMLMIILVVIF